MNTRNYSQSSNYMCGSDSLQLLPFYVQTINIPGINFSLPEIGGRAGYKMQLSSDTITFNSLSVEVIIDEDYKIYKEFVDLIFKKIDVEKGTFNSFEFDFWLTATDDMGKTVMKVDYYNCKIESISDVQLSSKDDLTENTFNIEIKYDYHKITFDTPQIPSLVI